MFLTTGVICNQRENKGTSQVSSQTGSLNFWGSWPAERKDMQGTWDMQSYSWRKLTTCAASKLHHWHHLHWHLRKEQYFIIPTQNSRTRNPLPLSLVLERKKFGNTVSLHLKSQIKAKSVTHKTPPAKRMSHTLHHRTEVMIKML